MEFSDQLMELRKQKGWSQEQLGEKIGVTRQTVSKWETGDTTPEMAKLIELSNLFKLSIDQLAGQEERMETGRYILERGWHYEHKSKTMLWGLPLVHINTGRGPYRAKGIIAIGNVASGLLAIGGLSAGVVSLGGLSAGVVSIGGLSGALLFSLGGISIGSIAIGGVAIGFLAAGGFALGMYSLGGCAVAARIAAGGYARGTIAIGEQTKGMIEFPMRNPVTSEEIKMEILKRFPGTWRWIVDLYSSFGH